MVTKFIFINNLEKSTSGDKPSLKQDVLADISRWLGLKVADRTIQQYILWWYFSDNNKIIWYQYICFVNCCDSINTSRNLSGYYWILLSIINGNRTWTGCMEIMCSNKVFQFSNDTRNGGVHFVDTENTHSIRVDQKCYAGRREYFESIMINYILKMFFIGI